MIDPKAVVHPDATIGEGVTIGPYSIIGADVSIGNNTRIGPHVVINGPTTIGSENRVFQFCSIGEDPQDKKFRHESESVLEIGDRNTIREFCTINRGTRHGGGRTVVGNDNWIMAYVHIAHDCIVGDNTIFANNSTLAGHVLIEDYVILGGFTGVHQFCHIGRHCFSAISSVIVKDVPPYLIISGNTARPAGLNREGLRRHGFSSDAINDLRKAYRIVYREGLTVKQALEELKPLSEKSREVEHFAGFIAASTRGIAR